jgi:hypothetical protein
VKRSPSSIARTVTVDHSFTRPASQSVDYPRNHTKQSYVWERRLLYLVAIEKDIKCCVATVFDMVFIAYPMKTLFLVAV